MVLIHFAVYFCFFPREDENKHTAFIVQTEHRRDRLLVLLVRIQKIYIYAAVSKEKKVKGIFNGAIVDVRKKRIQIFLQ